MMWIVGLSAFCLSLLLFFCLRSQTNVTEGLKNPFKAIESLGKKVTQIPAAVGKVGDEVKKIPKSVEAIPKKILTPIEKQFLSFSKDLAFFKQAWLVVVLIFKSLFSYLECGFDMVVNLPRCWYYYALDLVGQLIYLPIRFVVWLFSLEEIENAIWDYVDEADDMVKEATGYTLIHYSDSIIKKCYSCKIKPMPKI